MPDLPAAFTRAILWVAHPQLMWHRVGGMLVFERQLFTLARAGMRSVFIAMPKPADSQLAGLRVPRELEVCYVGISLITDYDVGLEGQEGVEPPSTLGVLRVL